MSIAPADASLSVRQRTYEHLKAMILAGDLRPAEKLSELALSKRLGISRTPLREALMKLEKEGLVTSERNVGYTVADLDIQTVVDLLEVRKSLDVLAAEQACARASDAELENVDEMVRQIAALHGHHEPEKLARRLELGIDIHRVIAQSTRNLPLIRVSEQIYQQLRLALWLEFLWVDIGDTDVSEHRAIADALRARDGVAAAQAARAHVESSLANMAKVHETMRLRRSARLF